MRARLAFVLALVASNVAGAAWAYPAVDTTTAPPARCCAALAYDGKELILYGGAAMDANLGDTWAWTGTSWTQLSPQTSPGILYNSAMAYDQATNTTVLFGGRGTDSQYVTGTWLWNGTTWSLATPTSSPPPRDGGNLAYDAVHGKVVLWGGCCTTNDAPYTDTWTWDGTNWQQQNPTTSPPASANASMAFDATTSTVVLLTPTSTGASTWTWDGANWTQQASATTPPDGGALAYDGSSALVLFQVDGTTWTWTANGWAEQAPASSPSARNQAAMGYDPGTQQIVLFGGAADGVPQNDAWSWTGTTWLSTNPPPQPTALPTPLGGAR
jgi:hypothetical protein